MCFIKMKIYWIAYLHQSGECEMIDGPFGTYSEAEQLRLAMAVDSGEDDNLQIVEEFKEVSKV